MSVYAIAKWVHVACVVLSVTGFSLRYGLSVRASPLQRHAVARIAPHVNDTILLAAAITMLLSAGINPIGVPWLLAKIVGLLGYIALGMVALRFGRSSGVRTAAFCAALLCFGYVVSVAITKNPLGLLVWLGG